MNPKQKAECMCLYCQITRKWNERVREAYKEGFRDGIESCKPNKKLDKAIKEGLEL